MKSPLALQIIFAVLILIFGYLLGNQFPWSEPVSVVASPSASSPNVLPPGMAPLSPPSSAAPNLVPPTPQGAPALTAPAGGPPQKVEKSVVGQSLTEFIAENQMSEAQKDALAEEITRLLNQSLVSFKPGQPPPDPASMEGERKLHEDRMTEILGSREKLTEFQRFQRSRELRATLKEWAATMSTSGTEISPTLQKEVRTIFIEEQEKATAAARDAMLSNPGQMGAMQQMPGRDKASQDAALEATWKRLEPILDPAALSSLQQSVTASGGLSRGGPRSVFPR